MNPVPIYNTRTLPTNYMCAHQDCISSAVKSTTLRVLSGSSCPPSHSPFRIRHSLLMPEFFFHSLFYPPPRALIQFSLPCHFPALPQWFSCVGHYHFSEDNLSTLVVKHETEVSRKSSDKSMSADNYCSSRITDNKLHASLLKTAKQSPSRVRISDWTVQSHHLQLLRQSTCTKGSQ